MQVLKFTITNSFNLEALELESLDFSDVQNHPKKVKNVDL